MLQLIPAFAQLLNKLQPLFASSSLFKDPNAQTDNGGGGGGRGKGKGRRKWKDERVKMGQGGTLDPLADGVLGEFALASLHSDGARGSMS